MNEKWLNKSRRNFIKGGVAGMAGLTVIPSWLKGNPQKKGAGTTQTKKIIHRTLGKTGLKVPVVSMGVMNADNPKLVEAALDSGIILLDTAHVYQRGRNEEMIGEVLRNRPRDSYMIATKIFEDRDRKTGLFPEDAKGETLIEKFETSLKRLGINHVEILHLHNISRKESVMFEPYLLALQKLKKQGKTRFIGVSTHVNEPEVIRAAADSNIYDVVLTAYNFRQPHGGEVKSAIAYAAGTGLGIVAMKTQAGAYWDRERLHPINMKAALKWVLNDENVHTAIPGFTTFDQLQLDVSVMEDIRLSKDEKKDLISGEKLSLAGLYCAQCRRCVSQCLHHLDIPTLMRSYMYAYGYRNLAQARETLDSANLSELPCTQCRTCSVSSCAMGFQVREKLLDIYRIKQIPPEFLG
jgi:aryl-alcohol dehydrogenase-like predicted oxidoreductase